MVTHHRGWKHSPAPAAGQVRRIRVHHPPVPREIIRAWTIPPVWTFTPHLPWSTNPAGVAFWLSAMPPKKPNLPKSNTNLRAQRPFPPGSTCHTLTTLHYAGYAHFDIYKMLARFHKCYSYLYDLLSAHVVVSHFHGCQVCKDNP